jgi:FixJ family two-component response regulator
MMPELSGPDLQTALLSRKDPIPIVFITALDDVPTGVTAMKKGAVDFLKKPFKEKDLLEAVEAALQTDRAQLTESFEKDKITRRIASLTPREREILAQVISGRLNKQIAYHLNISERTVKAHRQQVMAKMGIESVAELVRLTEQVGFLPATKADS